MSAILLFQYGLQNENIANISDPSRKHLFGSKEHSTARLIFLGLLFTTGNVNL